MRHLKQYQIDELKEQLLREKNSVEELNATFGLNESMREMTGELSVNDNHPGDVASELFERGKDIALQENRDFYLEQIMLALEGMELNTYGICMICDQPIPYERLKAIPYTPFCIEHADQEVSQNRPIEERFLRPPFGRTSMDDEDSAAFDGEDAWQIVASWGNSNSPALAEDRQIDDYDEIHIEADEQEGFTEPIESFLATDLYGNERYFIRNKAYQRYVNNNEGDVTLQGTTFELDDLVAKDFE